MATGFITFTGINQGPVAAFYRTQAEANAAALGNADMVAHVGALELGGLEPRHAYFDGTKLLDEHPEPAEVGAEHIRLAAEYQPELTHGEIGRLRALLAAQDQTE